MTAPKKSLDEMVREYAEANDNEYGSFLSRDLINIRGKAFKEGYSQGYLAAVDDLKSVSEEMAPKFTEQDGEITLEVVSPEHMADWLRERIREKGILK